MKRCAIYCRVSTGRQQNENQLALLRAFVALQLGWELVVTYCDEVSGGTSERPQFKAMMLAASRREFDVLLFFALDRLSREGSLATLQHLQLLTSYGIQWQSYTEPYLDSCGMFADVVVSIMATLARQEKIRISERTRAGLARAKRAGKQLGRPRKIRPERVRELRALGLSWSAISKDLGIARSTAQLYG